MPNKNYLRGRRFEYQLKKFYEDAGCTVTRAAGSHSPFDLIAVWPSGYVYLIQCKNVKTEAQAKKLLEGFSTNPPLSVGHYVQVMTVNVYRQGQRSTTVDHA